MDQTYREFFRRATGHDPYPYQVRVGVDSWPDVLEVPTGLGKTAAVTVAWLWKLLESDPGTPRRLVICLPMRVLVEQTISVAKQWIEQIGMDFDAVGIAPPTVHPMMGGEAEVGWRRDPRGPAILVGTQDMLLSRALLRGYGMSRYQWAIDFALLHNDAMWVFDEVQLMGPALATSSQLEAFRRSIPVARASRSLWMSATLQREWLESVDFIPHAKTLIWSGISDEDRAAAAVRLTASKTLERSSVTLAKPSATATKEYVTNLAREVLDRHRPDSQTLVIVNRVGRAQALFKEIRKLSPETPTVLIHSRFRPAERREIEKSVRSSDHPREGRIVVATQAVEAGVDISSATLFTELAPWSSLVQRFGRCNRYGEVPGGASVVWIDLQAEGKDAAPYDQEDLDQSREVLESGLSDVGAQSLPDVVTPRPLTPVIRRKDFLDLFNTEPDLSGFDVDISGYIRDPGLPQVQVFWREYEKRPDEEQPRPSRNELCTVSMGQMTAYFKKKGKAGNRVAWRWDPLMDRWVRVGPRDRIVPGSVLLLDVTNGGYDPECGFDPASTTPVNDLRTDDQDREESYRGDPSATAPRFIELAEHLGHVRDRSRSICAGLEVAESDALAVERAAAWHDVGKAHPAFQTAMLDAAENRESYSDRLWAKSPGKGRPRYRIEAGDVQLRPYFRHELASMLAWLEHAEDDVDADLVAFLIAAHHGKVRMGLRALPSEPLPDDDRLVARGVWDGDELPALAVAGRNLPVTVLRLDLMKMGRGPMGPSWTERTQRLLESRGPFVLAWLEALLRLADWQASAAEEEGPDVA